MSLTGAAGAGTREIGSMANKQKRTYEAPDMAAMIGRTVRAMVRRAAEGDREVLQALALTRIAVDEALTDSARALNDKGSSWAYIGLELGMTRQAAQQRFARPKDKTPWQHAVDQAQTTIDDHAEVWAL